MGGSGASFDGDPAARSGGIPTACETAASAEAQPPRGGVAPVAAAEIADPVLPRWAWAGRVGNMP